MDTYGTTQGLRGCLKDLKIGHQVVSLVSGVEPLVIEERWMGECGEKVEEKTG